MSEKTNLSFTWYWDGIKIFNSSKFSIWPLFLRINELRPSLQENMILAGIWFGCEKPKANMFFDKNLIINDKNFVIEHPNFEEIE